MKTASHLAKYRPLLLASLALVGLPFGLQALGLSLNTGIMVVALAIAAMGLNLCVGYTGLVSFGHGTWFGIGAYAAGLMQLQLVPRRDLAAAAAVDGLRRCRPRPSSASSSCAAAAFTSRC